MKWSLRIHLVFPLYQWWYICADGLTSTSLSLTRSRLVKGCWGFSVFVGWSLVVFWIQSGWPSQLRFLLLPIWMHKVIQTSSNLHLIWMLEPDEILKKIHRICSKGISGNTKGCFIWHSLTLMFKGLKSTFGSRYLLTHPIIRALERSAHSKEPDMMMGYGIRKEKDVPFREFHPQFQLFVKQNGFPRELKAFKPQMAFIATLLLCPTKVDRDWQPLSWHKIHSNFSMAEYVRPELIT